MIRDKSRPLPDLFTTEAALKAQGAHSKFPRHRNCQLFLQVSYVRRGMSPPTALRRLWRMPIKFGLEEFAVLEKIFVSATYVTLKDGLSPGRLSYNYH